MFTMDHISTFSHTYLLFSLEPHDCIVIAQNGHHSSCVYCIGNERMSQSLKR